ncbi:MAG TPA: hypothetical protein VHE30_22065 [Polyangiaceae bacterium]|nr:hypothetical protein [Polyangiaceae bacterium]
MWRFFLDSWHSVWDGSAPLGDRVRGITFVLLVLSLLAFFVGGIADRARDWNPEEERRDGASEWKVRLLRVQHLLRGAAVPFFPLAEYLPVTSGASVIASLLLGLLALDRELRWAAAAAAVPALLVLLQYVYLWAHIPGEEEEPKSTHASDDIKDPDIQAARARKAVEAAYGARTLFIRYGFPAIVLLIEGLVLVFALVRPTSFLGFKRWEVAYGAQFGALGAYVWATLELGRRSFRRDVTSGIALWCVVTLAVGPLLAASLALFFTPKPKDGDAWQLAVVFFYAGYAPRTVLAAITSAASQLLRVGTPAAVEMRTTPLTKIRGINLQIQDRLAEEGVDNVETLATVEPIRLHRDTSFDLRTILWWIDEALLVMYVPQRFQLLEEQGITGAIDLADLASPTGPTNAIDAIAKHANMTSEEFQALARRVRMDRHVNYVWWLYNRYGANGSRPSGDGAASRAPRDGGSS